MRATRNYDGTGSVVKFNSLSGTFHLDTFPLGLYSAPLEKSL